MKQSHNRFLAILESPRPFPVIVAHRGDSFHAPENTLAAARIAWEAGADAWELDVQLTRDGVAVVIHDESLVRTTDVATRFAGDPRAGNGFLVSEFDFDEVRSLDAGSWFVSENGGARSARAFGTRDALGAAAVEEFSSGLVRVPALAEALVFSRERDWLVNVEIKSFPEHAPNLVERVLVEIDATGTAPNVLISAFDHSDVAAANRAGRNYGLGILTATPLHRVHDYAREFVGADAVHVSASVMGSKSIAYRTHRSAQSLADLSLLKERRIPVLVYTVNDHGPGSLAEHLAEAGTSGLFTDDPQGMRRSFLARSPARV